MQPLTLYPLILLLHFILFTLHLYLFCTIMAETYKSVFNHYSLQLMLLMQTTNCVTAGSGATISKCCSLSLHGFPAKWCNTKMMKYCQIIPLFRVAQFISYRTWCSPGFSSGTTFFFSFYSMPFCYIMHTGCPLTQYKCPTAGCSIATPHYRNIYFSSVSCC